MTSLANAALLFVGAVGFFGISKLTASLFIGGSAAEQTALVTLARQLDRCGPEHLTCLACPAPPSLVVGWTTFVALVILLPLAASAWTLFAIRRFGDCTLARSGEKGPRPEAPAQKAVTAPYVVTPATRGAKRSVQLAIGPEDDDGAVDGRFLQF